MSKGSAGTNGTGYISKPCLGKPWPSQLAPEANGSLNPDLECQYCKDTSQLKETAAKQTRDSFVYGPGQGSSQEWSKNIPELDSILRSLSSKGMSAQTKISIMQQTVAKCPKVSISNKGIQIPSLLDSASEV